MRDLNFIKRGRNVIVWEAKTPLGTYRIMQLKPDVYMVDYTGLDIIRQASTLSTDKARNFDAAVKSAQEHSNKQIKLIVDWVDND